MPRYKIPADEKKITTSVGIAPAKVTRLQKVFGENINLSEIVNMGLDRLLNDTESVSTIKLMINEKTSQIEEDTHNLHLLKEKLDLLEQREVKNKESESRYVEGLLRQYIFNGGETPVFRRDEEVTYYIATNIMTRTKLNLNEISGIYKKIEQSIKTKKQ